MRFFKPKTYFSSAQPFTVPVSGYYRIAGKVHKSEPTGRMIDVENYHRRWWQFWKPKMITVPEFKTSETWEGSEVRFLTAGDVVDLPGDKVKL